ncbi:MAG: hypothetical protein D6814_01530 [Calditrichaeota bacterium]|nr:MAG: hypothetical protein D6814_01530 [Calditrichota bacterium]
MAFTLLLRLNIPNQSHRSFAKLFPQALLHRLYPGDRIAVKLDCWKPDQIEIYADNNINILSHILQP